MKSYASWSRTRSYVGMPNTRMEINNLARSKSLTEFLGSISYNQSIFNVSNTTNKYRKIARIISGWRIPKSYCVPAMYIRHEQSIQIFLTQALVFSMRRISVRRSKLIISLLLASAKMSKLGNKALWMFRKPTDILGTKTDGVFETPQGSKWKHGIV